MFWFYFVSLYVEKVELLFPQAPKVKSVFYGDKKQRTK